MRASCIFCGGWSEYRGLMSVGGQHAEDCGDRQRSVRQRVLAETSSSVSFSTPASSIDTEQRMWERGVPDLIEDALT